MISCDIISCDIISYHIISYTSLFNSLDVVLNLRQLRCTLDACYVHVFDEVFSVLILAEVSTHQVRSPCGISDINLYHVIR